MFAKYKIPLLLTIILIIAAFLRLWQLGAVPISPDWDEAAYGYNAYSVIHTGKDEFGADLPVVLRSFDDYKPALYLYLVIPFVALMGITTEAVRLPSALAGIIAVFLTYFLVKELCKRTDIALVTALLLAISPWHIQFSRIAFESNVGVLLNMSMVFFFLKGLRHPRWLLLAAISGALSIYAYQSEKVFTPLLAGILVIVYFKDLIKLKKAYLVGAVIVGLLFVLPMLQYLVTNEQALTRARETSIFADKSNITNNALRLDADTKSGDKVGLLFDNRRVFYLTKIIDGYLSHFSLNWLFITGDNNPRHHAPNMSLLYLVELPFLLLGIYAFLFLKINRKAKILILLWFLSAPVPASITSGVPHAVRTLNFLPLFQLFIAVGILTSFAFFSQVKFRIGHVEMKYGKQAFVVICLSLFMFNFLYYTNQYFSQMNYMTAKDWQYGYEEAVPFINAISQKYDKIIVTNKEPLDQSYIFFLYYLKFPPEEYHRLAKKNNSGGFAEAHAFGPYEFRSFDWNAEKKDQKTLYVGRASDFPPAAKIIKTFTYPDGKPAIVLAVSN